ncbi:DoxX family protein [Porphyromonadaceae sp. NP-X]|jgi:putative oxidoreductase|nr:DoxX family protein [Paludibacteraceae bacterium]MDS1032176.1 DoxX family protein [Porphyromonadaceae sp. NP-X]NLJ19712.1 DoxX family protein [Bacteroidales bacterium]
METTNKTQKYVEYQGTFTNIGLLIFRLIIGIFMFLHGWQKITNFEMLSTVFPDPLGIGASASLVLIILAEVGCSLLIIFGIFTRLAAIPPMFGMAVAAFMVHANDPFTVKEIAFLYLFLYVALFFLGAGKFSVDYLLAKHWTKKK